VFDHHQVQEALYGSLPEMLREEYHAAIGDALESSRGAAAVAPSSLDGSVCAELAEHFLKGGRGDRALPYFDRALDHLERAYRNDAAIGLAARALAAPGLLTGGRRVEVLRRKATRHDHVGEVAAQRQALDEALRIAREDGDPGLTAGILQALGGMAWRGGAKSEGLVWLEEALALARAAGDVTKEANVRGTLGLVLLASARYSEALEQIDRQLELSRALGDRQGEAGGLVNRGNVLRELDRKVEARASYEQGLALCRKIGHRQFEATALGNLAVVLKALGLLVEARAHYAAALALTREIGFRPGEVAILVSASHLDVALGRPRAALEGALAARESARAIGVPGYEAYAINAVAGATAALGDLVEAERLQREALPILRGIDNSMGLVTSLLSLASLLIDAGRAGEGSELLAEADGLASRVGLRGPLLRVRCLRATVPGSDPSDALAAFAAYGDTLGPNEGRAALFDLWKATGDPSHLAAAKRLLDTAVRGVPEEDRAAMVENVPLNRAIARAAKAHGLA
jgi:tetratricopeptide (TPR) repeat protein